MKYSTYEQIAEQYIIEQYGSLEILKSYDYLLQDKASQFMLKQMLQYCSSDSNEIKDTSVTNKRYWKRFIEKYRG